MALFTIFYCDGVADQSEVVMANEKPTEEQALAYLKRYVENDEQAHDWISLTGVYPTVITNIDTGEEISL